MAKVVDILKKIGAVITDDHFVYTSGKHGHVYINKDALYPHTKETSEVCEIMAKMFADQEVDVVAGPALGGIILSQWVASHLSELKGKEILGVYAEKDETGKQVGRLLPNRRNIIITLDETFKTEGAEIVHSIDELMTLLKETTGEDEEVFVIGGGMIYKLMIEKANRLYITHVNESFPDAEIFFPKIGEDWQEKSRDDHLADDKNAYPYSFVIYEKK